MQQDSRTRKSLLNAKVNMTCYMLNLVMLFFSRKIFIDHLGADFLGLSSTVSSLLGFLNLAELGVGQAIGVVLYKPIYDKNQKEINEIISILGFLYRIIGIIILAAGIILSCFLPKIFPNTHFSWLVIYLGFYSYLISALLGYFCNYKQNLLWADQRGYEITGYFQIVGLLKTGIQMALAYYVRSFVLFFCIEITFGFVYAWVLHWRVKRVYPWLDSEIRKGRQLFRQYPTIGKYTGQLFVHKIGGFIQFEITPLIIYSYASLAIVAFYNNYSTLATQIKGFISGVLDSTGAGVGSLIAEGNREKTYEIYKKLLSVRYFIAGSLCCCIFYLSSNFIAVWLGKQYILSDVIVLLICIQTFYNITRGTNEQFANGYGLFSDVWAPFVESAIFIVVAIGLGRRYGLAGVLCGPVASLTIIVNLWKPYFLYSRGLKRPFYEYWLLFFDYVALILISYFAASHIADLSAIDGSASWINWLLQSLVFAPCMFVISFILFYAFGIGMRGFVRQLILSRQNHG